jgi:hypothetical protein
VKVFERTSSIVAGIFHARTLQEQEFIFGVEERYEQSVAQGLGISASGCFPIN